MKIDKIRWKNFTSWGNSWHEMSFGSDAGLSLVCGVNGAGKSSISNLIIYMLYGQLDGFTQKDIPNRINKHFEGEIFFESKNHEVYIYRALSPNSFKVVVDGESVDTAGKNNVQKWLEEEVYGIPYAIFRNSIVLSINDFKSFVDLTPKEKRDIIDKIFGYGSINVAASRVRERMKTIRTNISACETNIEGYTASIDEINKSMSEAKSEAPEKYTQDDYDNLVSIIEEKQHKYKQICKKTDKTGNIVTNIAVKLSEFSSMMSSVDSKINVYKSGKCPVCGSDLNDDSHGDMKNELVAEKEKLQHDMNVLEDKSSKAKKIYEKLCREQDDLEEEINGMKMDSATIKATLEQQSIAKDSKMKMFENMLNSIEEKIAPKRDELSKLEKQLAVLGIVSDVFADTGLKQYISNIYVPLINNYVADVCAKLGIVYKVTFTTGYECEITFMGDEVSYKTLSTGERKKIDIAVTLAFLKIIKTKISDINILFLDEVLSSIDVSSCNELLKIFYDFSRDTNLRIYMVHHANLDSTWVDKVIEIEKHNGFSHFV